MKFNNISMILKTDLNFMIFQELWESWITFIPAWISNQMSSHMLNEITYPFPNLNSGAIEAWECLSDFIPQFMMEAITYPCWNLSQCM